jgi:hypothetical protein
MNTEQERADFEAWANGRCELHLVNPAGRYSSATTQFAWEAYQAGRAALTAQPAAATTAPSDETLRLAGIIADKIEDGTLFQAGIFSRRDLADKVRAVVRAARYGRPAGDAQGEAGWEQAAKRNAEKEDAVANDATSDREH